MMIEWLSPVEQHGTEFVYMPTWDARRPTGTIPQNNGKRPMEQIRIYATSSGATTGYHVDTIGQRVPFSITGRGEVHEDTDVMPHARYCRTDRPVQMMMNSTRATTSAYIGFGYPVSRHEAWGGYMVEMTPREQWPGFAPYLTPAEPKGMEHFINVVTD